MIDWRLILEYGSSFFQSFQFLACRLTIRGKMTRQLKGEQFTVAHGTSPAQSRADRTSPMRPIDRLCVRRHGISELSGRRLAQRKRRGRPIPGPSVR